MDRIQAEDLETREFFRIEDRLDLAYRFIEPNELESPNYSFDIAAIDKHHDLLKDLEILNKGANEILTKIAEDNAAIANYLRMIDHKIILLTKSLIYKADINKAKPRLVSLSEAGIAFGTNELLEKDKYLRIKLVLQPIFNEIAVYGKVVRVDHRENTKTADPDYHFWVAVYFTHLQNYDRQLLARYILHKQTAQRRGEI